MPCQTRHPLIGNGSRYVKVNYNSLKKIWYTNWITCILAYAGVEFGGNYHAMQYQV